MKVETLWCNPFKINNRKKRACKILIFYALFAANYVF